jgi:hypothetical protein
VSQGALADLSGGRQAHREDEIEAWLQRAGRNQFVQVPTQRRLASGSQLQVPASDQSLHRGDALMVRMRPALTSPHDPTWTPVKGYEFRPPLPPRALCRKTAGKNLDFIAFLRFVGKLQD